MRIRTKLTLWYAGVLFVSVLVIGSVAYDEFVIERRAAVRGMHEATDPIKRSAAATSFQKEEEEALLSVLSGAHNYLFPEVIRLLKQEGMENVVVFGGGIIPDEDLDGLKQAGVAQIFRPGTTIAQIVDFIHSAISNNGD